MAMRQSGNLRLPRSPRFLFREKCDFEDGNVSPQGSVQAVCSQPLRTRPRPGRRRSTRLQAKLSFSSVYVLTIILLLSYCSSTVHALNAGTRLSRTQRSKARSVGREIIFDERPVPQPALYRRAEASSIVPAQTTVTNNAAAASTSTTSSSSQMSIESAPTQAAAPLPRPFDGGLGTNYTQPSCPTFLKSMINNNTFTSCVPFSLLVQNSMSFFTLEKSFSSITSTLDASCNVNFPACSALMSSFAQTLHSSAACSQDYQRENPIVRQAYAGLLSYDTLYHASCLKNSSSSSSSSTDKQNNNSDSASYCFANAVTNLSSPTDSYVYYLPLGIPLPASSLPTCSGCLKNTMGIFAASAGNKTQPLSLDYVDAAQQINQMCGPGFVNGTIPNVGSSGTGMNGAVGKGMRGNEGWLAFLMGLMVIVVVWS